MAFIHGFRRFNFARCSRTGEIVLKGSQGQHLHGRVQKAAECSGISYAMWMTEKAKEILDNNPYNRRGEKNVPHEGPAPDWDCTCGAYFYRTLADAWASGANVYAHVTCLERTILHKNGGRTTQYAVDYLLLHPRRQKTVYIPGDGSELADKDVQAMAVGSMWGYPIMFYPGKSHDYDEVLSGVAGSLGVPTLEPNDLQGCPECLIANGWRKPEEISDQMRRDWFGEVYVKKEREREWKEHFDGGEDRTAGND